MPVRVCICCGQQMAERVDYRSWHTHVCAACAALADEEEEAERPKKRTRLWRVHLAAISSDLRNPRLPSRGARLH